MIATEERETIPVPAPEAARLEQAEAEFRAADGLECAYQMTAFLRAHTLPELGLTLGD